MRLKRVKIRALNYEKLENLIQKTSPDRAAQPLPCREGLLEQTKSGCGQGGNTGRCAFSGTLLCSQGCCSPHPASSLGRRVTLSSGCSWTESQTRLGGSPLQPAFPQGLPSDDPQEWVLGRGASAQGVQRIQLHSQLSPGSPWATGPNVMSPNFCPPQRSEKVRAWVWEEGPVWQRGSQPYGGVTGRAWERTKTPQDPCPPWETLSRRFRIQTRWGGLGLRAENSSGQREEPRSWREPRWGAEAGVKGSWSPEKWGSGKVGCPGKPTPAVRPGRPQADGHVAGCPDIRIRSQPDWHLLQWGWEWGLRWADEKPRDYWDRKWGPWGCTEGTLDSRIWVRVECPRETGPVLSCGRPSPR